MFGDQYWAKVSEHAGTTKETCFVCSAKIFLFYDLNKSRKLSSGVLTYRHFAWGRKYITREGGVLPGEMPFWRALSYSEQDLKSPLLVSTLKIRGEINVGQTILGQTLQREISNDQQKYVAK